MNRRNTVRTKTGIPTVTFSDANVQSICKHRNALHVKKFTEPTGYRVSTIYLTGINEYLIVPVLKETSKLPACLYVMVWSRNFLRYHWGLSFERPFWDCPSVWRFMSWISAFQRIRSSLCTKAHFWSIVRLGTSAISRFNMICWKRDSTSASLGRGKSNSSCVLCREWNNWE